MKFNFKKNIIVIILLIILIFTCACLYDNKENFQGNTVGNKLNNLFYDNSRSNSGSKSILPNLIEGDIQKYAIGFSNKNHTYKLSNNQIRYLDNSGDNFNFSKENQHIADNFPIQCNCYDKVTGSTSSGAVTFTIENLAKGLTECSGVLYFDLSLNLETPLDEHYMDLLLFNKNNLSDDLTSLKTDDIDDIQSPTVLQDDNYDMKDANVTINFQDDFEKKYYNYLNIGLKFISNKLFLYNGTTNSGIKVNNFNFALHPSTNAKIAFVNSGDVIFSLSNNDIENNMGISTSQATQLNNGLESGLYIHDVANSNIDANSNNVGSNSNNVYNYPDKLNVEFENSLGKLLNNKRLSQINGYNHVRDHYVNGYIADGDERLLTNKNTNNDLWFESAMNSKDNPIVNGNNMNNVNDLLRSNCSDTLNNNNSLNKNINDCGSDINESCKNNNCCSKINCRENGTDKNNRELKHIHKHSHKKNNEYKGEQDNENEIDDETGSGNGVSGNGGSGNGGSGNGGSGNGVSGNGASGNGVSGNGVSGNGVSGNDVSGNGGVFNNGRVGYNKNKAGNLDSNSQVNNNNRMNVNNNGYFNYNNVDSMTNVRPLVSDFSKF